MAFDSVTLAANPHSASKDASGTTNSAASSTRTGRCLRGRAWAPIAFSSRGPERSSGALWVITGPGLSLSGGIDVIAYCPPSSHALLPSLGGSGFEVRPDGWHVPRAG